MQGLIKEFVALLWDNIVLRQNNLIIIKNIISFSLSHLFFLSSCVLDFYLSFNVDVILKLPELLGAIFMYSTLYDARNGKQMAI